MQIYRSEASASLRRIPIWLVGSNGTSPATGESGGQPQVYWLARNVIANTGATLSVVSANAGEYFCELTASEVSQLGMAELQYRSANALQNSTYFQIVNTDSGDSVRYGLFSLPNAAAEANGGLITIGTGTGQLHVSAGSVGLKAQTHSQVTIMGVSNLSSAAELVSDVTGGVWYAGNRSGVSVEIKTGGIQATSVGKGNYSGVSMEVTVGGIQVSSIGKGSYSGVSTEIMTGGIQTNSIGRGNYSGMSVEILSGGIQTNSYGAGTYSGVTWQAVTRVNSNVTPADGTYSGVSVRIQAGDYSSINTVGVSKIAQGSYSGVSFEVTTGGIASTSFKASAIDAAAIATDGGQEIADRLLLRNIAANSDGGRTVSQAMYVLRNRTAISGSTGTTYGVDDTTSAFTFSVATVAAVAITEIDPGGV